jgi:hypothetical protein
MSVERAEPGQESTSAAQPAPRPPSSPRPPVLRLRREAPRVQVLFSAKAAAIAARQAPQDEFYDARRRALTLVESHDGAPHLQATGDPVDKLQERLMAELGGELAVDGSVPADVDAILEWLSNAPDFEFLLFATTLGQVEYDDGGIQPRGPAVPGGPKSPGSHHCRDCNVLQHILGVPPCCPGV